MSQERTIARRGRATNESRTSDGLRGRTDEDRLEYEANTGLPRWIPITALALSLIGLADATYLTITHFDQSALTCQVNSVVNCIKVTTSPQSEIFGVIPVAIVGLAYFVLMTILNLPPLWKTFDMRVAWARLALVLVGIGMVIYLISVELFSVKAICEYCTGVHVITFLLFVLVLATFPKMSRRSEWHAWYEDGGQS